ncbi:MAG: hypothetical protein NC181_01105 [Clostridium sp.]|nr:hypothetical protein [Clostridium sp.]MCM1444024.1 hypothetical protein [Candidatus Amulumruptor caecigallinarius]
MKKIKKEKLFRIVSICFLGFLFIFYGARFTYNYISENLINKQTSDLFSDTIVSKTKKENLTYENNTYTLIGDIDNNYVSYSGILWRVISVYDNEIKIVTDDSITMIPWGNNKDYLSSNINTWLNEKLLNNLTSIDYYIQDFDACLNITNNSSLSECKNLSSKISLLSLNDYLKAGANNSFINNGTYFFLSSTDENNYPWYVFDSGGVNIDKENHIYGVRAVISLKNTEEFYGSGTKNDPYIVFNNPIDNLEEVELGSYIDYSDYIWKVISKEDDSVKLVMTEPLKENDIEITKAYSRYKNVFDLNDKTGIAYYLNNTFYNKLNHKEYIKSKDYYIGKYTDYNLDEQYSEKVNCNVALLTLGDNFITEYDDMYLISSIKNDGTIPIIKKSMIFSDFVSYESLIKPVIYLDSSLEIKGGIGDSTYPFELRLEDE